MSYRATCQICKQLSTQYSRRVIPSKDLPPVLAVNTCVYSEEHLQYWIDSRNGRFLSPRVGVNLGTEHSQSSGIVEHMNDDDAIYYELRVSGDKVLFSGDYPSYTSQSIVVAIKEKSTHLVAIVKSKSSYFLLLSFITK